jgi:hypothetical protein
MSMKKLARSFADHGVKDIDPRGQVRRRLDILVYGIQARIVPCWYHRPHHSKGSNRQSLGQAFDPKLHEAVRPPWARGVWLGAAARAGAGLSRRVQVAEAEAGPGQPAGAVLEVLQVRPPPAPCRRRAAARTAGS